MNAKKSVIIKFKGGMGNQMFQYAFGKMLEAAANANGTPITLLFDTTAYTNPNNTDTRRPYSLTHFNTHANIAGDADALRAQNPLGAISKIIRRIQHKLQIGNTIAFDPTLLRPPYRNYYEGYWQSEKYFQTIAGHLRKEFTLREPLGEAARSMEEKMAKDAHSVSIFYRRTDYIGHSTFDIGEQDYQRRAIEHMMELVPGFTLYVMSDDIEWVKHNADLPAGSVFTSSKEIPPHEEMFLMSACRHHIIPNSSFAWWGAWLNSNQDKIVIAPKNWVRGNSHQYRDIVPESLIRV